MKKQIQVTMPDGSIWGVPAELVAENRSEYYADKDSDDSKPGDFDQIKRDEYGYTLKHNDELIDWAENNMAWNDVVHAAILIQPGRIDFQEGWVNGKKQVVQ